VSHAGCVQLFSPNLTFSPATTKIETGQPSVQLRMRGCVMLPSIGGRPPVTGPRAVGAQQ